MACQSRFGSIGLSFGCCGAGLGSSAAGAGSPAARASRTAASAAVPVREFIDMASNGSDCDQRNIERTTVGTGLVTTRYSTSSFVSFPLESVSQSMTSKAC